MLVKHLKNWSFYRLEQSVKGLYKRNLEPDSRKEVAIKKLKLEIEQVQYEKVLQ